eukprot:Pgem_evm1s14495
MYKNVNLINSISYSGYQGPAIAMMQEKDTLINNIKLILNIKSNKNIEADNSLDLQLIKKELQTLRNEQKWSKKELKKYEKLADKCNLNKEGIVMKNSSYIDDRLFVPTGLRNEILKGSHDSPDRGHMGVMSTYYRIYKKYYWFNMYADVKDYVLSCDKCQARN